MTHINNNDKMMITANWIAPGPGVNATDLLQRSDVTFRFAAVTILTQSYANQLGPMVAGESMTVSSISFVACFIAFFFYIQILYSYHRPGQQLQWLLYFCSLLTCFIEFDYYITTQMN